MAEEQQQAKVPSGDEFDMATKNLMSADPDIQTVLVSRLSQMSPEELNTMDNALTPQVTQVLMKLLPELGELINALSMQGEEMVDENMDESGMPKDMGALGNM